ncbi:MAG: hypothetical protein NVS1B11_09170 [Terriglobales bacterium]
MGEDEAIFIACSTQNVNLKPICAANGIPTVVPDPKKSPSAPAGSRRSENSHVEGPNKSLSEAASEPKKGEY